eukprot:gnl/TRDRNA2_/TRDRNA2_91272_c0_seq1.p1 gnl/TRDRNA2_/TRDRNA2_91272_c0~~gnl/TRDRNA2_/TRDRNA2_91272_c0_seq1.p1  ORF type:complete len:464 (+),score=85.60 gnl/TRDRNA2_/TRDRNA2_91272_c0_seq1:58-1449(+)
MADSEGFRRLLDGGDIEPVTRRHRVKAVGAVVGGSLLVLLSLEAMTVFTSTNTAESTRLVALPTASRSRQMMPGKIALPKGMGHPLGGAVFAPSAFSPEDASLAAPRPQPARCVAAAASHEVGAKNLDWPNLGFQYRDTNGHLKLVWREGEGWAAPEWVEGNEVTMHVAATVLHYGQAVFEGLKAHAQPDGSVALFRPQGNAERLARSCSRIKMPCISEEQFLDACREVVRKNLEFVPPYGSGGALYLRPVMFGTGPRIGLQPSGEYTFLLLCTPVGDYYKGGMGSPVKAEVIDDYDRAAPQGVGAAKVAGNYAADLLPATESKARGYPVCLYLDAATHTLVEEFSTSNFMGITEDGKTFVTPDSPAILPSVTNACLQQLAADMGLKVEKRPVPIEELESFSEAAAVGTAVVITPVASIQRGDKTYSFGDGTEAGPVTSKLYKTMRDIQTGDGPDPHGWRVPV